MGGKGKVGSNGRVGGNEWEGEGKEGEKEGERTVSLREFDAEARVGRLAVGFEVVFLGVEVVLEGVEVSGCVTEGVEHG